MEPGHERAAERIRQALERGQLEPVSFRAALLSVPATLRDAWLDLVLGLGDLLEDDPALPRGCVPYLPCSVDALLRTIDQAGVGPSDVFVDLGSGAGRAATLVHLFTGAPAIGIEIQPALVLAARSLSARLSLSRVTSIQGDAADLAGLVTAGSVFFMYCPFGGERLAKVLDDLESVARTRMLRICCVDLPLPHREWLVREPVLSGDVTVYRSTAHSAPGG